MTGGAIARRYARALLDVAIAESDPIDVERQLVGVAELIEKHADLRRVLVSPAVPRPRKRAAVLAVTELASELGSPVKKLLVLLAEKDRIGLLRQVSDAYAEALLAHRDIVRAEVTTAVPLAEDRLQALQSGLSRATGKQVTLGTRVDPAIIGGVVARIGSTVYDGSVTRQLHRLKARLIGDETAARD